MEVHFTPEQEAQLSQIASHAGTDTERLVKDAALRLLEQDAGFRAAVREGIAQAGREEFSGGGEMDASRRADAELPTSRAQNAREMGHPADGRNSSKRKRWMRASSGCLTPDAYPVDGNREASQTRDYWVAKYPTLRLRSEQAPRAARPDPSLRKERLLGMTVKLSHYPAQAKLERGTLKSSHIDLDWAGPPRRSSAPAPCKNRKERGTRARRAQIPRCAKNACPG